MGEKRIIIIGRDSCDFCLHAEDFCRAAELQYVFLNYENRQEILQDYKDFYNQKTVPIVLSNDLDTGLTEKVGGYSDLLEYTKTFI